MSSQLYAQNNSYQFSHLDITNGLSDNQLTVSIKMKKALCGSPASQNKDFLKIFKWKVSANTISIKPNDAYALIKYKNEQTEKQEFYYGSSFLSQSARFIN
jgi:hypothetical protein